MKTLRTLPAIVIAINVLTMGLLTFASTGQAALLNLSDSPLLAAQSAPPLTLMTMGRDHKLYYEAYNDASDLDGDGVLDVGYKPATIDYYGYFGSNICYTYNSGATRFEPTSTTVTKKCAGGSEWSGDFLNYLTTSRIDALRKVFYGGSRITDTASTTVLARSFIPQEAHSWGKEYASIAFDGYDIREYSPLVLPVPGTRHLFANTTLVSSSDQPLLRVLNDTDFRVWEWVSKNGEMAGDECSNNNVSCAQPTNSSVITNYVVHTQVCVAGRLEANCQAYPNGNHKPVGLLQSYGENDSMYFGLLTGSYEKNMSGGVLRKNIGTITDEINANDGTYTGTIGVIGTMDRLRIANYRYASNDYAPGWPGAWVVNGPMTEGVITDWGNPIAEMMYEGMRYFAGKATPTPAFNIANSGNDDATLGLPLPSWIDPYGANGFSSCAKPFQIVISDINPSYDSNQLPGSYFGGLTSDMAGVNVATLADTITSGEPGVTGSHFIGQSNALSDGAPTGKTVTNIGTIRGLSPEEPTKEGSYYSASIGYYGTITDVNPATGDQKIDTFSVALASPLPNIEISVAGSTITLVPFAKSVGPASSCLNISPLAGRFQPTNTIVDFYVETLTPTYGKFRINFEDVEQGADHDMDAIGVYEYTVNGDGTVTIRMEATYASGCIIQHMGYIISGTTADGTYLEIRDADTAAGNDEDYFLDTPNTGADLPQSTSRTFTPDAVGATTTFLKNPLWYAAKWGGFQENAATANNLPDITSEWDEDNDGDPDNYFLVTNALELSTQLTSAFNEIIARSGVSASGAALTSGKISSDTNLIRSTFNTGTWIGDLSSYAINSDPNVGPVGEIASTPAWSAEAMLGSSSRQFFTHDGSTGAAGGTPFTWAALTVAQKAFLDKNATGANDGRGSERVDFLRGDPTIVGFRNRVDENGNRHILGDFVNSSPVYVDNPNERYPDNWGASAPENASPYKNFFNAFESSPRIPMVYVGGNDGMLHGFNAETSSANMGKEKIAYIPNELIPRLSALTSPTYSHKFYVDGSPFSADVFFGGSWRTVLVGGLNRGGQAIYALDITNPSFSEGNASTTVLWEFSDANDTGDTDTTADPAMQYALGYTYSKPAIVRLHNGKWAAVFGNGYNNTEADGAASTSGHAVLYIVDIENGAVIRKINTEAGTAATPNGLATVTPVDTDGDYITDYIYAGDLLGNMWKFDLTSTSDTNWDVAYTNSGSPAPLFVAIDSANGARQPITAKANVGFAANGVDIMVYFGTGKYLEASDNTTTGSQIQTFYGIIDSGSRITGTPSTALLEQRIETFVSTSCINLAGTAGACDIRITTNNALGNNDAGWYIDLPEAGERAIYRPILLGGTVLFVTLTPSGDDCSPDGTSWFMQVDALDGRRLSQSPFDINGDGIFNNEDQVTYNGVQTTGSGRRIEGGAAAGSTGILFNDATGNNIAITNATDGTDTARSNAFGRTNGRQSWRQIK